MDIKEKPRGVFRLISVGDVNVWVLITHRPKIQDAEEVYKTCWMHRTHWGCASIFCEPSLVRTLPTKKSPVRVHNMSEDGKISVSVLGAGLFGRSLLIPSLKKQERFVLDTLVTTTGVSAEHNARQFGFSRHQRMQTMSGQMTKSKQSLA